MAKVSTYLNFPGNTQEAFNFYKSVFGGEFSHPITRMSDMPPQEGQPELNEADKNLVMHVGLPILGGHELMGSDASKLMDIKLHFGNNVSINLQPDTRVETDKLFNALSEGGQIDQPLKEEFWGDYYGSLIDKFGVQWTFACANKK